MAVRILIADDHPLVVRGMRDALSQESDIEIVAEAGTGPQALALIDRIRPEVVLMDLQLPGLDGMTCLERIGRDHPEVKVIICSASTDPEHITAAFRFGAIAYIVKSVNPVDLPSAIRQAHKQTVYQAFGLGAKGPDQAGGFGLTKRENTILEAVTRGLSNQSIAEELWVTVHTVKFHLTNIYRKLDVANRTAAARMARDHGLCGGSR
jgi:DNA-binding NarL/FixJ family response regulator